MSHPAFAPQPQRIIALWLVLISCPAQGRRLSWPGWLGEILRSFFRTKTVTHPSISRGDQESNSRPSSHKSNALTTIDYRDTGTLITMSPSVAIRRLFNRMGRRRVSNRTTQEWFHQTATALLATVIHSSSHSLYVHCFCSSE